MRVFIAALLVSKAYFLTAQDTVRSSVNFRTDFSTTESNKRELKPSHIYLGLQANQLFRQIFGGNGSTPNPFLITYGFNNKQSGRGLAVGLALSRKTTVDSDFGVDRKTQNFNFSLRMGYDKKVSLGKRWMMGGGFDFLVSAGKSFTDPDQGFETTTTSNGWGFGPRGNLLFQLSEKVYLGTETSFYFQSTKVKTEIASTGSNPQNSEQKETNFELQVPTVVFLIVRF